MKSLIAIVAMVIVVIAAGWAFFTFGGQQTTSSLPKQEILREQDERFSKGNPGAPVRIIEYADILCPYCAKVNAEVIPQIQSNYIDTGKVYYELRLVGVLAPDSMRAAEGAYCAAEHGKFWNYINTAYDDTWKNYYSLGMEPGDVSNFNETQFDAFVRKVGITGSLENMEWHQCMDENKYRSTVEKNKSDMDKMEAYGTPHFSINGKDYNGSPPYAVFKATIKAALKKKEAEETKE